MSCTSAENIVRALHGRRAGSGWMARCPAHEDGTPSLSITKTDDGRLLVHCHAGCSQDAVLARLRELKLWPAAGPERSLPRARAVQTASSDKERIAQALRVWCEAKPAKGTLVEVYLRSRGIRVAPPTSIRFHPSLRHRGGENWPAMVCLVTDGQSSIPTGVHRTWLLPDGRSKAPIEPNKMMLGPCGGGAVRLAAASKPLMIGEGIETCLAAMQSTGHSAWSALSTSGMRALDLPRNIRDVIILADGDRPGQEAARTAASRWGVEGRQVRIAQAPDGLDFNDLIRLDDGGVE